MDKEQFRCFQAAMDKQAAKNGMNGRNTSAGDRFDCYWKAFNSFLPGHDGVTRNEIIFIRRYCSMFGADVPEDFWTTDPLQFKDNELKEEVEKIHQAKEEKKRNK